MAATGLQDWLKSLRNNDQNTIEYQFPTDEIKNAYLSTIGTQSEPQIRALLREFLIPSVSLGSDKSYIRGQIAMAKSGEKLRRSEYSRRLALFVKSRGHSPPPWEGITWVLDLLPHWPRAAIQALGAYYQAHCMFLPDGRIHGLFDAMAIIRAWCIESASTSEEALQHLKSEPPTTLEYLVERLYCAMGYATRLTPRQNDGGYDVHASKRRGTSRVTAHIECKRWDATVGRPIMQRLLGVVSDKKATTGICVTTGRLTGPARQFVDENPRLDYLDGKKLVVTLNEHLGRQWYLSLDRLVAESRRACV